MKIAIKADPGRGKEIISLLESLGGINSGYLKGTSKINFYYIKEDNEIFYGPLPSDYRGYTLEEFEKEFPFKIGDKVKDCSDNEIGIILGFIDINGKLMYVVNFEKSGDANMPAEELKPYKIIKEERNITLTLDKAKEWYNKGGELKEIALQAYSEEELTKIELPKSWEEFCKQGNPIASWRYNIPTKYEALHKLELLRDCYRGLFITVIGMPVWCITRYKRKLIVSTRIWGTNETFLSFQSLKVAEEYLNNFKSLIKQAEDLI